MITERDLLNLAAIYAKSKGFSISTVSTYACSDGLFLKGLQTNKSITLRRAIKLTKWFAVNWPQNLQWPSNLPRPSVTEDDIRELKRVGKREAARHAQRDTDKALA